MFGRNFNAGVRRIKDHVCDGPIPNIDEYTDLFAHNNLKCEPDSKR